MPLKDKMEKLASFYEGEGLVREAYHIDVLLNTFDQKSNNTPSTQQGISDLSSYIEGLLSTVKKIMDNVEDNVEKLYLDSDDEKTKMEAKFRVEHKEFLKGMGDLKDPEGVAEREAKEVVSRNNGIKK